jgi:hypothetical protein
MPDEKIVEINNLNFTKMKNVSLHLNRDSKTFYVECMVNDTIHRFNYSTEKEAQEMYDFFYGKFADPWINIGNILSIKKSQFRRFEAYNEAQLSIKYVNGSVEFSPILSFDNKKERENAIKKLMQDLA